MLKKKVKELEKKSEKLDEKNKILLESEKELKKENTRLKSESKNQEVIKKHLQEKRRFIEEYYGDFIPNFEDICSFVKEKEMIFSLLNSFSEEFLQANLSKEKVFKEDVALTSDFLSLNYPSGRSIKIISKE
jgi:hypothetical protein